MKIGILHLTDTHLKPSSNWLSDKFSNIINAIKNKFEDCDKIYIVFTGDIANTGIENEYTIAIHFLNSLRSLLNRFYKDKLFQEIILTPGNHDCNFTNDNQVRKNAVINMNYDYIGNDDSVIEQCLSVQKDFWEFANKLNSTAAKSATMYEYIEDNINDKKIIFHCFNTAWMSSIEERPGSIFYPIKKIREKLFLDGDVNISLFHHHYSWLNPNTIENNKNEFSTCVNEISELVLFGHEHEQSGMNHQNIYENKESYNFAGSALQQMQGTHVDSGFQTFILDLDLKKGENSYYHWNNSLFCVDKEAPFDFKNSTLFHTKFSSNAEFINELNVFKLPLIFNDSKKVKLKDIFIFPDLDKNNELNKSLRDGYTDSSQLLKVENYKIAILEGENQSGKSSLLNMLYSSLIEQHKYPLLVHGKSLAKLDIETPLKKAYMEQYKQSKSYEEFMQSENADKVLLIDNLNQSNLNNFSILELLNKMSNRFGTIIATTSSLCNYVSLSESSMKDVFSAKILPLGHKKRNKLIEKYHRLNEESPYNINDEIFLDKIKDSYEQLQTFLGDKLIPSYPIFILSMLQSMNLAKPNNYEQTSFGYCYQSLIHFALSGKAKVKNENIDTYYNFLSELAFYLFENDTDAIQDSKFEDFYRNYSKLFVAPNISEIKEKLLDSGIVIEDDQMYKFGYNYIFYFLVARKIADILAEEKGKRIISTLCNNLHKDKNANILIFVTHHSKDSSLIDETILSSMVPFENIEPITLERNGFFYNLMKDIISEFKDDIINSSINPIDEREKQLDNQDKFERKLNKAKEENNFESEDNNMPSELISFHQAVRSLEIVGQIIKNRKGSIPRVKLSEMIKELYLTAFRTIGFLGVIIKGTKEDLTQIIQSKVEENDSNYQIEERINMFFQLMSLNFCLGIFSKVVDSVGNKELRPLFDEVAQEINTPAAKLVSFSIKTCYGKLSIKELKDLISEFEKNPVAMGILKSRVKSYLYNNYVDYKDKQKITESLKITIAPSLPKQR